MRTLMRAGMLVEDAQHSSVVTTEGAAYCMAHASARGARAPGGHTRRPHGVHEE